ncbi:MAG TPA: hypothetical protein VGM11_15180 [Acidobacteriaceae bacterium]|jgi:hypothetical protein
MRRALSVLTLALAAVASSSAQTPAVTTDALAPLDFLLGTWSARTDTGASSAAAQSTGTYTFHRDLNGHALVRSSSSDTCKGPANFDCNHHDQLTIFADPNALAAHKSSLLALYIDSEGHVIYYAISTPDPHTAVFNSQNAPTQPKFRLIYHLEGDGPKAVMTGKFQMAAPGSDDFHSYLEWSGPKQ